MTPGDTIAAISSAVGPAARIIVRVSGPAAPRIAAAVAPDVASQSAGASRVTLRFAGLAVPAWVYAFRAPRSYTGEDLFEFHLPGSPVLARIFLDAVFGLGARHADPGEFTARAYFNGRLDLTEAEGVAATIAAGSARELAAARQLLAGELARRLRPVTDAVAQTLALVEVGIDFVDEDVSFLSADDAVRRIESADRALAELVEQSARFERLSHEPRFVLVGRPNAGKSTLLNALAGGPRAVTSPVAGTTRDALSAGVSLPRGLVRVIDVAGWEEPPGGTGVGDSTPPVRTVDDGDAPRDAIERGMQQQAARAADEADFLVAVRDATDDRPPLRLPRAPDLIVYAKLDLVRDPPAADATGPVVWVSATTGARLDRLRAEMDRMAFGATTGNGDGTPSTLALNARHVRQLDDARAALARAADRARDGGGPELLALELRDALDALGAIVGHVTPDDLLGRIFAAFCIGK